MISSVLGYPVSIRLYEGVDVIASTFFHDELSGETLIIGDIKLTDNNEVAYKAYFYDMPQSESIELISRNQELIDATIAHILDYVFMEK